MKKIFRSRFRIREIVFAFVFCSVFSYTSYSKVIINEGNKVIYLQSDKLKIGLLPDVGGRMVFYGAPDGENLLFADTTLWNEPENERAIPSPGADNKAYYGHIIWLGPQSQWWRQQSVNNSRYERGDWWPPDPYLIFGDFIVEELTDTSIVLLGPESPVSGVQLTKTYIVSGNELYMVVSARNFRQEPVAWDLWSNARFDAFTPFRIPINAGGILKMKTEETPEKDIIPYTVTNGYFTLQTVNPSPGKLYSEVKAFLYPLEGELIVEKGRYNLVIGFDKVPPEKIHPEQALVEVYNKVSTDGKSNLLELEHHSAYKTIQPGGVLDMKETWTLVEIE